jgi:hypothetical protein
MAKKVSAPSERVRVKRLHERGSYDRAAIEAILDAQPLAHVGYVLDGAPVVTPTLQWREGDHVYWHASAASRMVDHCDGAEVCVSVALLDGLVIARSAFHHSINYRSVMLFGKARAVTDPDEKAARLAAFVNRLFPNRWDMLRPITKQELKATSVLFVPIDEASAKIRAGGPKDDEADTALDIWAGVLPLSMQTLAPIDDPLNKPGLAPPKHVLDFRIG